MKLERPMMEDGAAAEAARTTDRDGWDGDDDGDQVMGSSIDMDLDLDLDMMLDDDGDGPPGQDLNASTTRIFDSLTVDQFQAMLHTEQSYCNKNSKTVQQPQSQNSSTSNTNTTTECWRRKICQWSYKVIDHFALDREIVSCAMNILDRYLYLSASSAAAGVVQQQEHEQQKVDTAGKNIDSRSFQLAAMTSLYIAMKVNDSAGSDTGSGSAGSGNREGNNGGASNTASHHNYHHPPHSQPYHHGHHHHHQGHHHSHGHHHHVHRGPGGPGPGGHQFQQPSSSPVVVDHHHYDYTSSCRRNRKLRLDSFVGLSRGQFTSKQITDQEFVILKTLNWNVHSPTPMTCVSYLLKVGLEEQQEQEQEQQDQQQDQQQQQQEHRSIFGVSDIQVHHTKEDAPLLQTIPLLEGIGTLRTNHGIDQVMADESNAVDNGAGAGAGTGAGVGVNFADFGAEAESAIFNFQRAVSPANTPVEFLISHDWSIGICRLRPSSTSQWQDIHGVTSRRGDANNDNGSFNNETSHVEDDQQLRHREDVDAERDQPELVPVGSLVLFTLPHGRKNLQKPRTGSGIEEEDESTTENLESAGPSEEIISNTNQIYYRCQNVQVVSNAGMTTRNLLWSVDAIPTQVSQSISYDTASAPFASYVEAPGYLFLNDEADGFRLTWIATSSRSYLDKAKRHSTKEGEVGVTPNSDSSTVTVPSAADGEGEGKSERNPRTHIVTIESTWEEHSVTAMSGQPIYRSSSCPTELCASIISEAYLHIDRVLALVLQTRKGTIWPPGQHHTPVLPEFCYNLISTKNNGRTAQLLIVFLRPKGGYALGIFVDVDLFSGTYTEKNWVQDRLVKDAASMHFWCTKLTLNTRMKEVCAGPYALSARESNNKDWTRLCHEVGNINPDHDDDFDQNFWDGREASSRVISLASLYPCCDVVTNQALIDCCPVPSIRAKHSPIQLVYG
mmetsp:Transcript_45657/g.111206  ORF Transcript_45657/g.111206 Transcript_45657/m.111206 type:complete len:952 (+) Transcript_45657:876-3731(+)